MQACEAAFEAYLQQSAAFCGDLPADECATVAVPCAEINNEAGGADGAALQPEQDAATALATALADTATAPASAPPLLAAASAVGACAAAHCFGSCLRPCHCPHPAVTTLALQTPAARSTP